MTQADSVSLQAAENVELADRLVCEVLRGEQPLWPEKGDAGFEQTFQQRSFHHGVQALIYDGLHATDVWSSYPPQTRGLLTDSLRAGAAYDLLRAHRVSGFLEELSRRHIPFLVIKGDALARTHYSNTSLRVRSDTDLFIHMGDISAVQKTLLDLGFEVIPPIYKTHQFTGVWGRESNAAVIFDIHWRMLNAARFARIIGFTEALEHSISIPGMNHCRTLGAVDSLLLACMHRKGSDRHDEDRLIWLYDIHLLVSNMTAQQLEDLTKSASERGVQSCCLSGLLKATKCFHTEFPGNLVDDLQCKRHSTVLFRPFGESHLGLLIDDIMRLPGVPQKLGLMRELFFPSAGFLMGKYNKSKKVWLPFLYLRYVINSAGKRLMLK